MAVEHPLRARIQPVAGETPSRILSRGIYLPAILRGFGWSKDFSHTEYDTIRDGQFSQPAMGGRGAPQLLTLNDVETLTVVWNPKWLADPERRWGNVREALERIGESKVPVNLMVKPKNLRNNVAGRETLLLHEDVTFRSLSVEMREGEPDTLYFTLGIKEWRSASGRRRGSGKPAEGGGHNLGRDDTLHSLAMKYFNSAGAADAIAKANGIKGWGKSTPLVRHQRFKRGSKIKIPSIPRTSPAGVGPGLRPGRAKPRRTKYYEDGTIGVGR